MTLSIEVLGLVATLVQFMKEEILGSINRSTRPSRKFSLGLFTLLRRRFYTHACVSVCVSGGGARTVEVLCLVERSLVIESCCHSFRKCVPAVPHMQVVGAWHPVTNSQKSEPWYIYYIK